MFQRKKQAAYELANKSTAEGVIFERITFAGVPKTHFAYDVDAEQFVLEGKTFLHAQSTIRRLQAALQGQAGIIEEQRTRIAFLEPFQHKTAEDHYIRQIFEMTKRQKQLEIDKQAYRDQYTTLGHQHEVQLEETGRLQVALQTAVRERVELQRQVDALQLSILRCGQTSLATEETLRARSAEQAAMIAARHETALRGLRAKVYELERAVEQSVRQRAELQQQWQVERERAAIAEIGTAENSRLAANRRLADGGKSDEVVKASFLDQLQCCKLALSDAQQLGREVKVMNGAAAASFVAVGEIAMRLQIQLRVQQKNFECDKEEAQTLNQSQIRKLSTQNEKLTKQVIMLKAELKVVRQSIEGLEIQLLDRQGGG
ncbi:hypothetical protein SS50377_27970 [Spironucleus salmonicida]|uniref:Uncharacterized protein n=1 Tax=Spironucleus salmonicida TaxID=348837 RepID=V6LE22_9EUKA|nr:hypothetical protein SS50377_27970 [Spironucleus salmonicida]|eukprot:EST42528.1 Hypothetical protein SS50377_17841 [Spironucleus salmonicida]